MQSRKTPYGWMALGGMLCLLGLGLACKMREGNQARAQAESAPLPAESSETVPLVPLPQDSEVKPFEKNIPPLPSQIPDVPPVPSPMPGGLSLPSPVPVAPHILEANGPTLPVQPLTVPVPIQPLDVPVAPTALPPSKIMKLTFEETAPPPAPVVKLPPETPKKPKEAVSPHSPQDLGGIITPPVNTEGDKIALPPVPMAPSTSPLPPATTPPAPVLTPLTPPTPSTPPSVSVPLSPIMPVRAETRPSEPGEPPLAPAPGPVQMYQVRLAQESLREIARRTLGDADRWSEIHKLNPTIKPEIALLNGTVVRLPADACLPPEEVGEVKPLPLLRVDAGPAKPKVLLPLTGTYPCNLDEKRQIALPKAMRDQIGDGEVVMVSPGPDHCLWVTTQDHLERMAKRLEASPARENEVRGFRRLYFAQTEKLTLSGEGRIQIPDRLTQFAGLHQEVVLIGIDDHFELWDVARWRQYTQAKSAAARSAMSDD